MTIPTNISDASALLAARVPDHTCITVDKVEAKSWGALVGFQIEGVSLDHHEIVHGAKVKTVFVGQEEFNEHHALRIDMEAVEEDEDEEAVPEAVMVAFHSAGEAGDETHNASISGTLLILREESRRAEWSEAVEKTHADLMRRCLNDVISLLDKIMSQTSERTLAGIAGTPKLRRIMRRLAAAA